VFRGLMHFLSYTHFSELQDSYQIPTAFDGEERCNTATPFALGYNYWSAIRTDNDFYYSSLYCIYDEEDDKSILFYFCFPVYCVAFPMYSGSVMCFNPLRYPPHGTSDTTKKGVHIFSAYVSSNTCNTHVAYVHSGGLPA
jgi:hypothetical protein